MGVKKEKLTYETMVRPTIIVEGCPVSVGIVFNRPKRSMGFYGSKRIKAVKRGVYHFFAFSEKPRFTIRYFHRGWFRKVVFDLEIQVVKVDGIDNLPMELSGAIDLDPMNVEPSIFCSAEIMEPNVNESKVEIQPDLFTLDRRSVSFKKKYAEFKGNKKLNLKKTTIDCKIKKSLIEL